jgi:hypothetical protein
MDLRLLEDILDRIAADDIETARGVQWIKELV